MTNILLFVVGSCNNIFKFCEFPSSTDLLVECYEHSACLPYSSFHPPQRQRYSPSCRSHHLEGASTHTWPICNRDHRKQQRLVYKYI